MGGLAVLFLIGIYLVIAYKVVRAFKAKRVKWLAVVILALIPTADAIVGRIYLKHLCATEGGLKVNRVVEGVQGYMDYRGIREDSVKAYKYQFIESTTSPGKFYRYSRKNGNIVLEMNITPKSLYEVRFKRMGQGDVYTRSIYDVADMSTGEILAAYTEIGFGGGWAERFLAKFSDAGSGVVAWCGPSIQDPVAEVVFNSLKN